MSGWPSTPGARRPTHIPVELQAQRVSIKNGGSQREVLNFMLVMMSSAGASAMGTPPSRSPAGRRLPAVLFACDLWPAKTMLGFVKAKRLDLYPDPHPIPQRGGCLSLHTAGGPPLRCREGRSRACGGTS